jgi:hypothetical protein
VKVGDEIGIFPINVTRSTPRGYRDSPRDLALVTNRLEKIPMTYFGAYLLLRLPHGIF